MFLVPLDPSKTQKGSIYNCEISAEFSVSAMRTLMVGKSVRWAGAAGGQRGSWWVGRASVLEGPWLGDSYSFPHTHCSGLWPNQSTAHVWMPYGLQLGAVGVGFSDPMTIGIFLFPVHFLPLNYLYCSLITNGNVCITGHFHQKLFS